MFFVPIGDTPNQPGYIPWMTWLLIAANVAVYLLITVPLSSRGVDLNDPQVQEFIRLMAPNLPDGMSVRQFISQITAYDLFTFTHGYKPGAPSAADLVSAMFLHGGFLHLFGNMLFLWIYGDNIEYRLGRTGFLAAYLFTGVVATLTFAFFAGYSLTPMVGASGAISGVLGMYFILFPKNRIKVFVLLFPFFMNTILVPARLVLAGFIIIDNLLPWVVGASTGVAYGAHIGGFFAGLAIAWTGEQVAWQRPWKDSYWRMGLRPARPTAPAGDAPVSPLADLRASLRENAPAKALEAIAKLNRNDISALEPAECVTLAEWLEEGGHPIAATHLLRGCLARHARSQDLADVYLMLGLMRLKQGQPAAAYQHLLSVFDHHPGEQTEKRAREALARINIYRGPGKGTQP